jgi:hypothetical protein
VQLWERLICFVALVVSLAPSLANAQSAPGDVYSGETVWDWYNHGDDLPALCGVGSWFDLHPESSVADEGCVEAAMRQLGASESAVQFFEMTMQFLYSFDERGAIDFGIASSPWLNMGRGEGVLLNGRPSAILMSRALNPRDDSWKSIPEYADLLQLHPNLFPWVEYGGPMSERQSDSGSTVVEASFDMRECRACPNIATFREQFTFDPAGYIAAADVLAPGAPRQ